MTDLQRAVAATVVGERVSPQDGDVIIAMQRSSAGGGYVLHQFSHRPQLLCSSHEEAIEISTAYAREQGVNVWYSEGGEFVLAERHRHERPAHQPTVARPLMRH